MFHFFDNKLYGVSLSYGGIMNSELCNAMLKDLMKKYGIKEFSEFGDYYIAPIDEDKSVRLLYNYDNEIRLLTIQYFSAKLYNERIVWKESGRKN
jgi:hypothetical protein